MNSLNSNERKRDCCKMIAISGCSIMTLMFMGLVINSLILLSSYEKTNCNITEISTPNQLPSENNRSGWEICDCGSTGNHSYH